MEDPIRELPAVVHGLTTSTPDHQKRTLEAVFLPNASFSHPFVLLPPLFFPIESRTALLAIYRFYKFLSPNVSLRITSIALDNNPITPRGTEDGGEKTAVAYVRADQTFRFWFWPFWDVDVELVAQLTLVQREEDDGLGTHGVQIGESGDRKVEGEAFERNGRAGERVVALNEGGGKRRLWYIKEQKDLYQFDQFVAYLPFLLPGAPTLIRAARRIGAVGTVVMCTILGLFIGIVQSMFDLFTGMFGSRGSAQAQMNGGQVTIEKEGLQDSEGEDWTSRGSNSPARWLKVEKPKEPLIDLKGNAFAEGEVRIL
ncbi:hypothetical protein BJ508DRAFT_411687 [Ascobolus immersus RN42]|uniref:SigF-like NTF2-like domain-containing protein n=1 Tax=Ascobolus immersus RN42 TaxID=1160509 RepID=A0A3N4ING1_ASCIM|nr:hypothetical protein BJ508DRAFT_411687 [Ascobolus immersus RN42]